MPLTPARPKYEDLRDQAKALIAEAGTIAKAAEDAGRGFTVAERAKINDNIAKARDLKARADAIAGDPELIKAISELGGGLSTGLAGTGRRSNSWAAAGRKYLTETGRKTLEPSGTIQVPSISTTIPVNPDRPRSILNLIPFRSEDGDLFSYLREVERTHAASTVARGKLKPRSTYSLERIDDRCRTIAHLSDPVDRSTLADAPLVEDYLGGALRDGCLLELENQVLNGDASTTGVLDDLTGIINTSGVQSQAWSTDVLTTTRKAVTKLEDQNLDPAGFAFTMSPGAWEAIELTTDTDHFLLGDAAGNARLPVDRAARRLWGLPVVVSAAVADDATAVLGDFGGSAVVHEREGVVIEWSEAVQVDLGESGGATASAFEVNQRVYRAELRAGLEVSRPAAFVVIDLSA